MQNMPTTFQLCVLMKNFPVRVLDFVCGHVDPPAQILSPIRLLTRYRYTPIEHRQTVPNYPIHLQCRSPLRPYQVRTARRVQFLFCCKYAGKSLRRAISESILQSVLQDSWWMVRSTHANPDACAQWFVEEANYVCSSVHWFYVLHTFGATETHELNESPVVQLTESRCWSGCVIKLRTGTTLCFRRRYNAYKNLLNKSWLLINVRTTGTWTIDQRGVVGEGSSKSNMNRGIKKVIYEWGPGGKNKRTMAWMMYGVKRLIHLLEIWGLPLKEILSVSTTFNFIHSWVNWTNRKQGFRT